MPAIDAAAHALARKLGYNGSVSGSGREEPVANFRARIDLLASIWPRLRPAIEIAAPLGADWSSMSTAFERTDAGEITAHAGVLEIPMVVDGNVQRVAGIHAVCTAAAHRGKGLGRAVIEAAIDHASGWADVMLLHANDAAIYGRYGFRSIAQWVWGTEVPQRPRTTPLRKLSASRPEDVAAVHAAFVGRLPVAESLGIGAAASLFVLDEILACLAFERLWIADDLGVVVAFDLEDRMLQIYDVVGPRWPALHELVARMPGRVDRVEAFFVPERWPEVSWTIREGLPIDVMMVRGPFTDADIAMPPLARC